MATAKIKTVLACQQCGYQTAKWLGKCPECGSWNSFSEETTSKAAEAREQSGFFTLTSDKPLPLSEISQNQTPRCQTNIKELDRVLGGGLVPGSLILLGGDPGIGKSTLILQAMDRLVQNHVSVLYVTGEESKEQIKIRADRLKIGDNILVVAENSLDKIIQHVSAVKPMVLVIDSIQTVFLSHLESAPGSVSQVRECAGKLLYHAKTTGTATILIGHVTKEGAIAGPRILEHMVDTVLYFEGENSGQFRMLRTMKNRYGSTNEIGVFEMTTHGLSEVGNPSAHFLRDRSEQGIGSCVTSSLEGTRPILVEVQSLVSSSSLANPRRTMLGIDSNRVALIIAVLEKYAGINLFNQDVFVNIAGGIKINEPATDFAVMLAMISSFRNKPLSPHLIAIGEFGLTGEIRSVNQIDQRLSEALKMGYKTILMPAKTKLDFRPKEATIIPIKHVNDALDQVF